MPIRIQPTALKYKNGNTFQSADCIKGDKGDKGDPGDPTELIDDTSTTATDKVWSAKKSADEVSALSLAISQKYEKPSTGIPASDLASGVIPAVPVQDVQVNGTSILSNGVANVPVASANNLGVVGVSGNGITLTGSNNLAVQRGTDSEIKAGTNNNKPIVPISQHQSVFYGLAKLAGADMKNLSGETVGVYPDAQKIAIQKMLGIYQAPWELIREDTFTNAEDGDVVISVDGNGQPFEITDVNCVIQIPNQDTTVTITGYALAYFYYGTENRMVISLIGSNPYTVAPNTSARIGIVDIRQSGGMAELKCVQLQGESGRTNVQTAAYYTTATYYNQYVYGNPVFNKVVLKHVTGTVTIRLYGKRKWN